MGLKMTSNFRAQELFIRFDLGDELLNLSSWHLDFHYVFGRAKSVRNMWSNFATQVEVILARGS